MRAKHPLKWPRAVQSLVVLTLGVAFLPSVPAIEPVPGPVPQAPPVPPPVLKAKPGPPVEQGGPDGPTQLWSIGQPTDEEQLYLEYINRSRANPTAEGARLAATTDPDVLSAYNFFGVDLILMQQEFSTNPAVQPLAPSLQLMTAARLHSGDMYTNQYQGHNGTDGSDLGVRITAQGYPYLSAAENVYSYAVSVWQGHAGFNVDWGPGVGGMQNPPGHRNNIHNGSLREVGVGVVDGVNGSVGPQLVTQDFGVRQNSTPFITGVVYYDFNGNGFYDLGEGIGGVRVDAPGSAYYAITADSGGFAIPVTTNGTYAVTFSATGLNRQTTALVASGKNVKLDYVPSYNPPIITGPNPAAVNQANGYTISAVGASVGYDWLVATLASYTAVEGAETLNNVTISNSPSYSPQATFPVHSGNYAFHLAHPGDQTTPPTDQFIYLNTMLLPSATSALSFWKQLSWASSTQIARAQVSTNSGASWIDVWTQTGNGASGDSGFSQVSVSLAAYAGSQLRLRFMYDYTGGQFYFQTDPGIGFCLDDIAVSNATFLFASATNSVSGNAFSFIPTQVTNYLLAARARLSGRTLDWGPAFTVSATVSAPPPVLQLSTSPAVSGGQVQINFTVASYRTGMTFQLLKAASPETGWSADTTATLQTVVAGSQYRFVTSTGSAGKAFYRVQASY